MMHPLCLVPTAQPPLQGGAMILGGCRSSGVGAATRCAPKNEVSRLREYAE